MKTKHKGILIAKTGGEEFPFYAKTHKENALCPQFKTVSDAMLWIDNFFKALRADIKAREK